MGCKQQASLLLWLSHTSKTYLAADESWTCINNIVSTTDSKFPVAAATSLDLYEDRVLTLYKNGSCEITQ